MASVPKYLPRWLQTLTKQMPAREGNPEPPAPSRPRAPSLENRPRAELPHMLIHAKATMQTQMLPVWASTPKSPPIRGMEQLLGHLFDPHGPPEPSAHPCQGARLLLSCASF